MKYPAATAEMKALKKDAEEILRNLEAEWDGAQTEPARQRIEFDMRGVRQHLVDVNLVLDALEGRY